MNNITFAIIKPDAVKNRNTGKIYDRIISAGFEIKSAKLLRMTQSQAEGFYAVHKERPFFGDLVDFISSGPVIALAWEGDGVILSARKLIGATKPLEAEPGTIRGDLAIDIGRNIIHGSDGEETAKFEINLWFNEEELCEWETSDSQWRSEN